MLPTTMFPFVPSATTGASPFLLSLFSNHWNLVPHLVLSTIEPFSFSWCCCWCLRWCLEMAAMFEVLVCYNWPFVILCTYSAVCTVCNFFNQRIWSSKDDLRACVVSKYSTIKNKYIFKEMRSSICCSRDSCQRSHFSTCSPFGHKTICTAKTIPIKQGRKLYNNYMSFGK